MDFSCLTERQRQVLDAYVRDPNEARIARQLGLQIKTVHNHLYRIQRKLHVPCRVSLMRAVGVAWNRLVAVG